MKIDIIAQDNNITGESPLWDSQKGRLIWSDIDGGKVYEYYPDLSVKNIIGEGPNIFGIALNRAGGLVVGRPDGLYIWRGGSDFSLIVGEFESTSLAVNDIIAGPDGQVYFGTFYWGTEGMEKTGGLFGVWPDGTLKCFEEGIVLANGLAISPDSKTLYFADSAERKIFAYDIQPDGTLSGKKVFAVTGLSDGIPDGLTVDSEGFLWCALWYGGKLIRYAPDGRIDKIIKMPVTQVSSLAFGGAELDELYITSAGEHWQSNLVPEGYDYESAIPGGQLFRIRPGVKGKAEHMAAF